MVTKTKKPTNQLRRFLMPMTEGNFFQLLNADGEPLKKADLRAITLDLPSNPSKDDGARVSKTLPTVAPGWMIDAEFLSLSEHLDEGVFRALVMRAGIGVGLGCWRPGSSSGGLNGRFKLVSLAFARGEDVLGI